MMECFPKKGTYKNTVWGRVSGVKDYFPLGQGCVYVWLKPPSLVVWHHLHISSDQKRGEEIDAHMNAWMIDACFDAHMKFHVKLNLSSTSPLSLSHKPSCVDVLLLAFLPLFWFYGFLISLILKTNNSQHAEYCFLNILFSRWMFQQT